MNNKDKKQAAARSPSAIHHSPFTILLLLILLLSGCRSSDDAWPRIEASGVLRVGLDPTYPPFENLDENGRLHGLDVDLARELAQELGLEAEFVFFGFDGLYDALATEQVDVLISGLVLAPERGRDFAFSEPYFNAGQVLVVPQDSEVEETADLNGRTLAVELGALGHVEATKLERQIPDLNVVPHNSTEEALAALTNQEAQAALVDHISARLFIRSQPMLQIAPDPVTVEPFALVVRIDDVTLLERLNDALERIEEDRRLEQIIAGWLDN